MKILVVEDEDTIREIEKAYLERANHKVLEARDGQQALELFKRAELDLIVLDLNLPKIDGIEVCRRIRAASEIPIIMVTARVEEIDELIGLEIGADDYLKKPFSPSILVARVNNLLRRVSRKSLSIGELIIDPDKMYVSLRNKKISLTTTQFNILYTMASSPGKVFTRDEILNRAYDSNVPPDVLDRTIDSHIKSIRKVIETDTSNPKYILTVIGRGYKFNDELE